MGIKILTDSASDLPNEILNQYEIEMASLVVLKGDEEYFDRLTISPKTVYDGMRQGQVYTTSQVPAKTFEEKFEKYAKNKDTVIYIAFSSELSGTYQVSVMVRDQIKEKYPDFDIDIIDTKAASIGQGLIVLEAAKLAKEGKPREEILKALDFYLDNIQHIFTVDNLEYLLRGGRVTKTQAFVGGLLNIKPILNVEDGKLFPLEKVRGKNKVYRAMLDLMEDRSKKADLTKEVVGICHADNLEDAIKLKEIISEKFGVKDFLIGEIGAVVGAHVGPGTVGIFFMEENYKE